MHPEHIPSAAPEQDYLSRFYAPFWSHISVENNFHRSRRYGVGRDGVGARWRFALEIYNVNQGISFLRAPRAREPLLPGIAWGARVFVAAPGRR